jgi:hypothetical protein
MNDGLSELLMNTRQLWQASNQYAHDLRPTHHIRLTLLERRSIVSDKDGAKRWVNLLEGDNFECAHRRFVYNLSKKLTPRSVWKRFHPVLKSVGALHGAVGKTSLHVHLNIYIPEWVDEAALANAVTLTAEREPWVANGAVNVNISRLKSAREAVYYTIAKGNKHIVQS